MARANCGGNIQNTVCDDISSDPLTWIDNKTFEVVPLTQIESWGQLEPKRWRLSCGRASSSTTALLGTPHKPLSGSISSATRRPRGHSNSNDFSSHGVIGGEAVDEFTLNITCGKPCPILPKPTIFTKVQDVGWFESASEDDIERMTVGLGPYRIVEWRAGVEVELEAFEDYKPNNTFDAQDPADQHLFQVWGNESLVRAAMLEAGEADWAEISSDDRGRVPKAKVGTNNLGLYLSYRHHAPS